MTTPMHPTICGKCNKPTCGCLTDDTCTCLHSIYEAKDILKNNYHLGDNMAQKPWGHYNDYYRDAACVFKVMTVNPGQSMSYQTHEHRHEVWFVGAGTASVKISPYMDESALDNYTMSKLSPGDYLFVQVGTAHQISNNGDNDLIIYEMQFSPESRCSEDDITRLEDPHNRQ